VAPVFAGKDGQEDDEGRAMTRVIPIAARPYAGLSDVGNAVRKAEGETAATTTPAARADQGGSGVDYTLKYR